MRSHLRATLLIASIAVVAVAIAYRRAGTPVRTVSLRWEYRYEQPPCTARRARACIRGFNVTWRDQEIWVPNPPTAAGSAVIASDLRTSEVGRVKFCVRAVSVDADSRAIASDPICRTVTVLPFGL